MTNGRRGSTARGERPRWRRALRITAFVVSGLVLITAGAGWWAYQHLDGNIRSVSLTEGVGRGKDASAGKEEPDAFGRTPINILVIGSDGRTSKKDCKLGGGCADSGVQHEQRADVEMVLHISADRSNATVMSIPRDTMVQVPACRNPETGASTPGYRGMVNGALTYGQACQVATVHRLTGIPIDHFVQLDFSGVVKMSDAVGGVSVCVSDDVYDTYSHLKLAKGDHTLKGYAALAFVRSRHGFGDGSDLGRTYAQHIFLSSLIRTAKSAGTLANPAKVYRLADAATKAITVDDGLGSIKKLIGLARDADKVPADRFTFTTMQTVPDAADRNRVVPARAAGALFAAIAADRDVSGEAKSASAGPSASASPSGSGSGPASTSGSASPGASASGSPGASPGASAGASPDSGDALSDAHARTAGETGGCAKVSHLRTVEVNGVAVTPGQAYAAFPDKKDSAD